MATREDIVATGKNGEYIGQMIDAINGISNTQRLSSTTIPLSTALTRLRTANEDDDLTFATATIGQLRIAMADDSTPTDVVTEMLNTLKSYEAIANLAKAKAETLPPNNT